MTSAHLLGFILGAIVALVISGLLWREVVERQRRLIRRLAPLAATNGKRVTRKRVKM